MESLELLELKGTSIRQLPRSVVGLKNLFRLSLCGNGSQPKKSRFWWGLSGLYQNRNGFVLSSLDGLLSLYYLNLSNRGLCEGDLPSDIGCLSNLEQLMLSGNNFVSLPASIGCLSKLQVLKVKRCQSLEQLPNLSKLIRFNCANCFVLVDNEGCDSIILRMLKRYLQFQRPIRRPYVRCEFEIVTPGREIPEWFSNQSLGDSLTVELPTTWMGIALCAVFEFPADLSEFRCFMSCSPQGMRPPEEFSKYFKIGEVESDHLWVIYASREQFKTKCSQINVLFRIDYCKPSGVSVKKCGVSVKECGFRLVHKQDVEQLNQMMMNKSIIKSTTTCPTKSADAQGQQHHDDEEASPRGSGSSHQKSLFCNTYALSKGFLTKLVKIFSLFLTTAVFMKSFNNTKKWGCMGLLIWRVTTLIFYLGLAPSYFELLLQGLIKTVILKRGAKFLLALLKTPPPQMSAHKYLKGQKRSSHN
ncbi:disease resistance protein RPS4-like isoform X2 [Prunus avium]|uniref:Disease resistance protein RPS4-like isoform X2 n=1 Tax=Prunus avium TaxID=42229 RepID=A0A6P5U231_PRUAV|nr:disease resistance protein RPS4-like isoform X2 [Prunus avium]